MRLNPWGSTFLGQNRSYVILRPDRSNIQHKYADESATQGAQALLIDRKFFRDDRFGDRPCEALSGRRG